jgi:hypothetical protein
MKLELSRKILGKYSNIEFRQNTSTESRVVPCGRTDIRTDRHDEATSRFSQFLERAYKLMLPALFIVVMFRFYKLMPADGIYIYILLLT